MSRNICGNNKKLKYLILQHLLLYATDKNKPQLFLLELFSVFLMNMSETAVYKRRWYILLVYSFLCLWASTVWLTWGPVAKVAQIAFPSWTDGTISLLINWAAFVSFPGLVPCLVMVSKSVRLSVITASGLMALGTSLRCVKYLVPGVSDSVFTITCHICAALCGISGSVTNYSQNKTPKKLHIQSFWFS